MNEANPSALALIPKSLRLLKWHERVRRGDFVEAGNHGVETWVGPSGFRADAFVKQIYRRLGRQPAAARKAS